jgi:uncharacterized protein
MQAVIKNNIEAIRLLCKQSSVLKLYLFGSAVSEHFSEKSDIDFIVEYVKNREGLPVEAFDYFDFLFSLEKITGRKVDLVVNEAIRNSYFKKSIEESKILIYE